MLANVGTPFEPRSGAHVCVGDRFDPTHECWCDSLLNHSAAEHRARMQREREQREVSRG
jgi:hypothetical protein